jgi:hypothetical protein
VATCQMRTLSSSLESATQAGSPYSPLLSNSSRPHCLQVPDARRNGRGRARVSQHVPPVLGTHPSSHLAPPAGPAAHAELNQVELPHGARPAAPPPPARRTDQPAEIQGYMGKKVTHSTSSRCVLHQESACPAREHGPQKRCSLQNDSPDEEDVGNSDIRSAV